MAATKKDRAGEGGQPDVAELDLARQLAERALGVPY
jgi:hypothetical protein